MITKKDIRDWMIQHNVYDGDIQEIDSRLKYIELANYSVLTISVNFDDNGDELKDDFNLYFAEIKRVKYKYIPDDESQLSYLDILEKL